MRGVALRRGEWQALSGIDLRVYPGDVVGILGRTGAGKRTLLELVVGLLRPQEGSVRVFGRVPTDAAEEVRSTIGYVPSGDDLPHGPRVREWLSDQRVSRPSWDEQYARQLQSRFGLKRETFL